MTLTERILNHVRKDPFVLSSTDVAKSLKVNPSSVSGIMCRLAKAGKLTRERVGVGRIQNCRCVSCKRHKKGTWVYQ